MLVAFSFDYSRAPHGRYYGNTQQRYANRNRLHPITTHHPRQNRKFQIAHTTRHDHGTTRLSQVRSFGECGNIYCGLRRVRAQLCNIQRWRPRHGYLGCRTGAEHGDRLRPPDSRQLVSPIPVPERLPNAPTCRHLLRYHLVVYYLNALEQRCKAMQGHARCTSSSFYPLPASTVAQAHTYIFISSSQQRRRRPRPRDSSRSS